MRLKSFILPIFIFLLAGCASTLNSETNLSSNNNPDVKIDDYGILLMAHGGTPQWNAGIHSAIAPLMQGPPIEIAFGMADANSIQDAVARLEAKGVRKIGVVRLFVSGESWYERTEKILGIREGAPQRSDQSSHHSSHDMGEKMQMSGQVSGRPKMGFWKIATISDFAMSKEGLAEASSMDEVLLQRAKDLSRSSQTEDVLILAHGPADDEENERWIANIIARTAMVKNDIAFRKVKVMTLREDWRAKRVLAVKDIRKFVLDAKLDNGTAIVIPYRIQGFGPYAKVLEGLDYVSDGKGLVPHENVTLWIKDQSDLLRAEYFSKAN